MAQINTRTIVLLASGTRTASGTGPDMVIPQGYTAAIITLNVGTVGGTSPTLAVYVQNKLRQAGATDTSGIDATGTAIYDDLVAFGSATATGIQVARVVGGGNVVAANNDAALTTATVASGPIGGEWRVKFVHAGTSPSFAFSVVAEMIP